MVKVKIFNGNCYATLEKKINDFLSDIHNYNGKSYVNLQFSCMAETEFNDERCAVIITYTEDE